MDTKNVYSGKWLDIYIDTFRRGNKEINWERCSRKNNTKAIMIVPYNIDNGKYIMIKEFRIPIKDYEIGFPAGLIESGENISKAIKRELKEETGLDLVEIVKVSPFTYTSSGMTDESIAIVFVKVSGKVSNKFLEPIEDIMPMLVSKEEMNNLLQDSTLKWGSKAWLICNSIVNPINFDI